MPIKNLQKAAQRIKRAVKNKERIILYGDSDLDGVSAVLILEHAIKSLGGNVAALYFPDRPTEGYGITKKALEKLQNIAPALFVTVDLGISNFEEVKLAKKAGFEVIIIDHHVVLDGIPEADIVVDPKQPGDSYPFKEFAACGLALRVAESMLGKNIAQALENSMKELAALGTIADMMPRREDNIVIIEEGITAFTDSWRPGIRAFFETKLASEIDSVNVKAEQLISILNVREIKDGFPGAYRLLTAPTLEEAKELIESFIEQNKLRKERIQLLVDEIQKRISTKIGDPVIFEGGSEFDFVLLGAAASIIAKDYRKPTFLFLARAQDNIGSVRAPSGFNTVEAMKHCSKLLNEYGGHPQASGFSLPTKNTQKFRKCLIEYFNKES